MPAERWAHFMYLLKLGLIAVGLRWSFTLQWAEVDGRILHIESNVITCISTCCRLRRAERRWASWVWWIWLAASGQQRPERRGNGWKKGATSTSESTEHKSVAWDLEPSVIQFLLRRPSWCDMPAGIVFFSVYTHLWFWFWSLTTWNLVHLIGFSFCLFTVTTLNGISHIYSASLWAWLKSYQSFPAKIFLMLSGRFFDLVLPSLRCSLPSWCPPLIFPSLCSFLQVAQHSGFSHLSLGWPGSREEQEQVCSLQGLCAHLAAQGTKKTIANLVHAGSTTDKQDNDLSAPVPFGLHAHFITHQGTMIVFIV